MQHYLDKKMFYEQLKPFQNKYVPIDISMSINMNQNYYILNFGWHSYTPAGKFNPNAYAQFYDFRVSGPKKYICPDLSVDLVAEGIKTDYQLWRYLDRWISTALENKKRNMRCM